MNDLPIIVLGAFTAGVGWLIYDQSNRPPPPPPVVATPEPKKAPAAKKSGGLNLGAILQIGLDLIGGSGNGSTKTDQGAGAWLDQITGAVGSGGAPVNAGNLERNLLNLIGSIEAPGGYSQVYGGSRIRTPKPLTQMTVGEVLDWQRRSVSAGSASSAAGRYQIIRPTLQGLVDQGHVSRSDLFDRNTQDRLGIVLMKRRGLDSYKSGMISATTFGQRLSQEWASLPAMTRDKKGRAATGQSYYAGDGLNKALTSKKKVLDTLNGRAV